MNDEQKTQEAPLATVPEQPTALATSELDDMFGGSGYQIPIDAPLPQLTILRETPMFETPDGEAIKEVVGHIIHWHHANQFYATEFGEGEQGPPTCASSDGIKPDGGEEPLLGLCRNCPNNEYGTAKEGKGKACSNTIRLYVLQDGDVIPCVVKASPASLGKKESLMKWLTNAPNVTAKAGMGTKYQPIQIKLKLHTKDFADSGFKASVLDVETVRVLTRHGEDMAKLKALGLLYRDFMANYVGRIASDVGTEQTGEPAGETVEPGADDKCPI